MNYAEEIGHNVIGFTDHETVSSWVKIEKAAQAHPNLKVIRGNEIYLCRNGLNSSNFNGKEDKYFHFILLAKDLEGAHQIFELSTKAWKRSYMARGMRRVPTYYSDLEEIVKPNPGHIVATTACISGYLPDLILKDREENELIEWINYIKSIFGEEDFYLEMQPSLNPEQIKVNRKLYDLSLKTNTKYIITTDSHYLNKSKRKIHKIYLKSQNGDREVDEFYATTYMMDTEEIEGFMKASFEDLSIVRAAYSSIEEIGNKCTDFSLLKPLHIPSLRWKEFPITVNYNTWCDLIPNLQKFLDSEYESDRKLVDAIIYGIQNHPDLQNKQAYNEINDNLEMTWVSSEVNKARWSSYFLNLQRIIEECWNAGTIVGAGRGSGVGFLLLYVLDITQINPLRETTKLYSWRLTRRV